MSMSSGAHRLGNAHVNEDATAFSQGSNAKAREVTRVKHVSAAESRATQEEKRVKEKEGTPATEACAHDFANPDVPSRSPEPSEPCLKPAKSDSHAKSSCSGVRAYYGHCSCRRSQSALPWNTLTAVAVRKPLKHYRPIRSTFHLCLHYT